MNRKLLLILIFCFWVLVSYGGYLESQEFMPLTQAESRYGVQAFSADQFRKGDSKKRAQIVVSLIKSKVFLGKDVSKVKEELGAFTGYFFSSKVPAYLIEEGWLKNQDTWQVVFLLDDVGKVTDVRIHKNCCTKK